MIGFANARGPHPFLPGAIILVAEGTVNVRPVGDADLDAAQSRAMAAWLADKDDSRTWFDYLTDDEQEAYVARQYGDEVGR
jgi:hypothetical protein